LVGRKDLGCREPFFASEEVRMLEIAWGLWPFGCRHKNLSVPFSMEKAYQQGVDVADELPPGCSHYVVCLNCGQRFGYDWSNMKVVKGIKTKLKPAG
jgi:hypothetical protein